MKRLYLSLAALFVASNAEAAVVITPTTLTTTEDGSAVTYRVSLDSLPSAGETVTVTPSSGDVTEGTVSAAVMFTLADYTTPQFITVTPGASGDGNDGDVMYTITNAVSSNQPAGNYAMEVAADVNATNVNIEGVDTITVNPSSGLFVTEGANQVVTIAATGAPASDIVINLTNNTAAEITLSTNSVTLTAGNGYSATVTITAIDDALIDGDLAFSVTTGAAVSADLAYNGVDPVDINGLAVDNDAPAVVVTPVPVPTLGEWTRIGLALLLATFGILALASRRKL